MADPERTIMQVKKSKNIFQLKPGWVFNPWLDFICFYLPIIVPVFFELPNLREILILKVTFDTGHVFATLVPLYFFRKSGMVNMKSLLVKAFAVLAVLQIVCFFYFPIFTYLLGYYALFHIGAQLYGWLAKIQRTSLHPILTFDLILERVFLIFMLLSSILFWHTTYSEMKKSYFYDGNLAVPISFGVWQILNWLFLGFLFIWLARLFYNLVVRKFFPMGKVYLLLSVWLMFYWNLVFNHSRQFGFNFFWFSFVLNHGLTYLVHVFISNEKLITKERKTLPSFLFFLSGIFLIGVVWSLIAPRMVTLDFRYAAILVWGPLILHYVIDATIWRSSFLKHKI